MVWVFCLYLLLYQVEIILDNGIFTYFSCWQKSSDPPRCLDSDQILTLIVGIHNFYSILDKYRQMLLFPWPRPDK